MSILGSSKQSAATLTTTTTENDGSSRMIYLWHFLCDTFFDGKSSSTGVVDAANFLPLICSIFWVKILRTFLPRRLFHGKHI